MPGTLRICRLVLKSYNNYSSVCIWVFFTRTPSTHNTYYIHEWFLEGELYLLNELLHGLTRLTYMYKHTWTTSGELYELLFNRIIYTYAACSPGLSDQVPGKKNQFCSLSTNVLGGWAMGYRWASSLSVRRVKTTKQTETKGLHYLQFNIDSVEAFDCQSDHRSAARLRGRYLFRYFDFFGPVSVLDNYPYFHVPWELLTMRFVNCKLSVPQPTEQCGRHRRCPAVASLRANIPYPYVRCNSRQSHLRRFSGGDLTYGYRRESSSVTFALTLIGLGRFAVNPTIDQLPDSAVLILSDISMSLARFLFWIIYHNFMCLGDCFPCVGTFNCRFPSQTVVQWRRRCPAAASPGANIP